MNNFTVDGWEVRFLHSNPVTVCVIRNLKKVEQRFTGLAICNPNDKWDCAEGRHKALKDVLIDPVISNCEMSEWNISFTCISLPTKAIHKAYWKHYRMVEK